MSAVLNSIQKYFQGNADLISLGDIALLITRADGVPVYDYDPLKLNKSQSIGALIGGVWQASKALSDFLPTEKNDDGLLYRLSFDTSSNGIYIVPAKIFGEEYYVGIIYKEEVNPGLLKSKIRQLVSKLVDYVKDHCFEDGKIVDNNNLFDDISDDEMDQLFAFVGN